MEDEKWMRQALELARQAAQEGEVPVGCVVVCNGEVVGQGRNRRESGKNALYHAELLAIDEACRRLGGWRLWQCTLYVTLEPCPMCAGAILNARIPRVVFGARDEKAGACGERLNLLAQPNFPHPKVCGGVLAAESLELLQQFFQQLRENPPPKTNWRKKKAQADTQG